MAMCGEVKGGRLGWYGTGREHELEVGGGLGEMALLFWFWFSGSWVDTEWCLGKRGGRPPPYISSFFFFFSSSFFYLRPISVFFLPMYLLFIV